MARGWCGAERADAGVVAVSATASGKCVSVLLIPTESKNLAYRY